MDCNGNIYNIGMGCCEPVLGPIENYYTKPATDRKIEEAISGISAVTIDEVQEMIDESISGITVSGVTEEQMNEAIASAKTEIEGEIPSLDGYATEQWVEDKHYITGVDLSDYALKSEIPVVPTSNTAFTNDAGYLTEHQSLSGYATEAFVSGFTYDKATIDEKVAGGGSFDPSQYYNKTATDELLAEKLDATAYTPTDLSNYYTTGETVNLVESAVTRVEGEIPTVPTSNTAFTNDAGYLTEHQSLSGYATEQWVEDKHYITGVDLSNYATKAEIPVVPTDISAFNNDVGYITGVDLSNYATKDNLTAATDDMATKTWVGQQGYLTEHQSLTAYSTTEQVNSAITQAVSGKQDTLISGTSIKTINNESLLGSGNITIQGGGATYTAGTGIDITSDVISTTLPISSGSGQGSIVISALDSPYKPTATGQYSYAEGMFSTATGYSSHAEGYNTKANGKYSHAEGNNTTADTESSHAEGNNTKTSGNYAHAEGSNTRASGMYSHAEGCNTNATGTSSHAEGYYVNANGNYSHVEGYFTKADNSYEHASGSINVTNKASTTFGDSGNTLFSIGNGQSVSKRHNAFEVRQNGDVYIPDTNDASSYDAKPMIKLQDSLVTAAEKTAWNAKSDFSGNYNDLTNKPTNVSAFNNDAHYATTGEVTTAIERVERTFTGKTDTTAFTAHTSDSTVHVTSSEKSTWDSKANIWCGSMAEYQRISGSTDNNTIYLIHS